jgi:hypothetical protein
VIALDTTTWAPIAGRGLDTLPGSPRGLHTASDGALWVGGTYYLIRVDAGGARAAIADLPSSSTRYFSCIDDFGPGRTIASTDAQLESGNIAVIEGQRFLRWLRLPGIGNRVTTIYGLAYLR